MNSVLLKHGDGSQQVLCSRPPVPRSVGAYVGMVKNLSDETPSGLYLGLYTQLGQQGASVYRLLQDDAY